MKTEIQEILDVIEKDEYYDYLNEYAKRTLSIIADIINYNGNCTYKTLEMICIQSKISQTRYLSDLIKFLFLGYITRKETGTDSENLILGSKKLNSILKNPNWKKQHEVIKLEKINHLKLWLNSKINSIKGENYLTRYKGQTIENIYKQDPKYLIEKISNGNFILSLSSIEILEKKYKYQFPIKLKDRLRIANKEYLAKSEFQKSNKNIVNLKIEYNSENKITKNEFIDFLNKSNYRNKIIDGEVTILSDFCWEGDISLIDNLTIIGNLKVSNLLESPKIIPRGLKVDGYIQFGSFEFTEDNDEKHSFDVWLKLK